MRLECFVGEVFHGVHVGRIAHVAREDQIVLLFALHRLEKVVIDAVGDDEDFIAFRMWEQVAVGFADDAAHVEVVEDGSLVARQTAVLHIIYRSRHK